jgi:hypothetical protein
MHMSAWWYVCDRGSYRHARLVNFPAMRNEQRCHFMSNLNMVCEGDRLTTDNLNIARNNALRNNQDIVLWSFTTLSREPSTSRALRKGSMCAPA